MWLIVTIGQGFTVLCGESDDRGAGGSPRTSEGPGRLSFRYRMGRQEGRQKRGDQDGAAPDTPSCEKIEGPNSDL